MNTVNHVCFCKFGLVLITDSIINNNNYCVQLSVFKLYSSYTVKNEVYMHTTLNGVINDSVG